jgi:ketosteroid isomerase-like protein
MGEYSRDELEQAFRTYWRTGAAGEDWDAWADLFTEDCVYFEHFYGTMHGRETVRAWIKPIMAKYRELYTVYEWHVVDEERGRVVFYMQNRRDRPDGRGTVDFPGISILEYAGNGRWRSETDFWAVKAREQAMKEWDEACRSTPPDARRHTRNDWGQGPEWTRGAGSYEEGRR